MGMWKAAKDGTKVILELLANCTQRRVSLGREWKWMLRLDSDPHSYISGMCRGPVPIPVSNVGLGKEGRECLLRAIRDALCVHKHSPTTQELDLHFWSEVNGLFVKWRTFVSPRKHSAPAISP